MAKIIKVLKPVKYGADDAYVIVTVQLDHGGTAEVWVGGEVEERFDHGRAKAFVKRKKNETNL